MLKISVQAFQALEAIQELRFIDGIVRILHEEFPEEVQEVGSNDVAMLVRRTCALAMTWGVTDQEAIGQLCALAVACGEDMLQDPGLASFLTAGKDVASRIYSLMDEIDAIG